MIQNLVIEWLFVDIDNIVQRCIYISCTWSVLKYLSPTR